MGGTRLDREMRRARTRYSACAQSLLDAVRRWNELQVPVPPDSRGQVLPWSPEQLAATEMVAQCWRRLVEARRDLDAFRAEHER